MSDKTELDALARMNAARDANTCPASRHAAMIAEALVNGEPYLMLSEEPKYCGETIAAVVASLWETRTALTAANARAERLEAKMAKAVEGQKVKALEQILEERGAVFDAMVDAAEDAAGKDVSFNVVVGRALRAALAEIKGESHE